MLSVLKTNRDSNRDKLMPGTIEREHRKLICAKTMSFFGYGTLFLLSGMLPMIQNLHYNPQKRLSDVLPNQLSRQRFVQMNLHMLRYPIRLSITVLCCYRAGVLKRRCGGT